MILFTWIWQIVMAVLAVVALVSGLLFWSWGYSGVDVAVLFLNVFTFSLYCLCGYFWRSTERSLRGRV